MKSSKWHLTIVKSQTWQVSLEKHHRLQRTSRESLLLMCTELQATNSPNSFRPNYTKTSSKISHLSNKCWIDSWNSKIRRSRKKVKNQIIALTPQFRRNTKKELQTSKGLKLSFPNVKPFQISRFNLFFRCLEITVLGVFSQLILPMWSLEPSSSSSQVFSSTVAQKEISLAFPKTTCPTQSSWIQSSLVQQAVWLSCLWTSTTTWLKMTFSNKKLAWFKPIIFSNFVMPLLRDLLVSLPVVIMCSYGPHVWLDLLAVLFTSRPRSFFIDLRLMIHLIQLKFMDFVASGEYSLRAFSIEIRDSSQQGLPTFLAFN